MPTHAEKRILPHRPDQLFDLVADVARYPEFLPWCIAARVRSQSECLLIADLVVGFKGIRESFTSRVSMDREAMKIDVTYENGPFKYLNNHWIFESVGLDKCEIDFYLDFDFKSRILQRLIGVLFNEAVRRMVRAFEQRAAQLYG